MNMRRVEPNRYGTLLKAYTSTYALQVLPVFILSWIFLPSTSQTAATVYAALSVPLVGLAIYLAERPTPNIKHQNVQKSLQWAVAPAIPALFAAVLWGNPGAQLGFAGFSVVVFSIGLWRIKGYSTNPQNADRDGPENS